MSTFKASAASLLSQCTDDLLKDDCTTAIECEIRDGDGYETNTIFFQTLGALISSFSRSDLRTQGLYRLSGNNAIQKTFLDYFENMPIAQVTFAIERACALKALIRKMKNRIFPYSQRAALINVSKNEASNLWVSQNGGNPKTLKALRILCWFIPNTHRRILHMLLPHLMKVVAEEKHNKMSLSNIAMIFTPLIFPVIENGDMKESERDITNMSKLLAICALHSDDLFSLPDDLIHSVDNSIRMQREDSAFQLNDLLQSEESEPVIATPTVYCSPSKSTTQYELAKLMAEINSMKDESTKKRLMKSYQKMQREKLGIDENKIRKPFLSLNLMSKLSKSARLPFSPKSKNTESETETDEACGSSICTDDLSSIDSSKHDFDMVSIASSNVTINSMNADLAMTPLQKKALSREYLI
uniref:Rho-GAP domain-containing protein n=1 Tax=Acrobeloides nanus TaxID=290746 RepID=A0A914C5I0_9BILA